MYNECIITSRKMFELTRLLSFEKEELFAKNSKIAGEVLKTGGLVAFPTETVYGLGANALMEESVKKIFEAKGRPSDNPLIVHVADIESVEKLVLEIPLKARLIMENFWPGPISIIMKKSNIIPDVVSAGLDSVAVRMPSHPVALAVIKESGVPVAAPSANISGKPSPTLASHVMNDMSGKIDIVADGGECAVGIESTVIDCTREIPVILRPGGITAEMLESVVGKVISPSVAAKEEKVARCPGMKYTHYSPDAEVYVVECGESFEASELEGVVGKYGVGRVGILDCGIFDKKEYVSYDEYIDCGNNSKEYASKLFIALREFDKRGVQSIFALINFKDEFSDSVRNRLYKSAGNKIIRVNEVKFR